MIGVYNNICLHVKHAFIIYVSTEKLYLFSNQLKGATPSELGELPNLDECVNKGYVRGCLIMYLLVVEWCVNDASENIFLHVKHSLIISVSTVWIYLFNNELTGAIPSELGELENLSKCVNKGYVRGCLILHLLVV